VSDEYGQRWAEIYDQFTTWRFGPEAAAETVSFLAARAGPGPVLELGVGTGRIALPLAERGIDVHGIDASSAMVERLRAKPGGDGITVTIGDFADVDIGAGRSFPLVFVVFNTLFALLTQDDQVRCFANVAARLAEGGAFVVEAFVPDVTLYDRGQRVSVTRMEPDAVQLDVGHHDVATQRVSARHVHLTEDGLRLYPVELRYAWPSELDLMARLAGLRLRERFGGWQGEPFGSNSGRHVSVYEQA